MGEYNAWCVSIMMGECWWVSAMLGGSWWVGAMLGEYDG